jgi:hypothetical protein
MDPSDDGCLPLRCKPFQPIIDLVRGQVGQDHLHHTHQGDGATTLMTSGANSCTPAMEFLTARGNRPDIGRTKAGDDLTLWGKR